MDKQKLITALNNHAKDLGLTSWIEVKNEIDIPIAMQGLAAPSWVVQFPENENTKLIREQIIHLWTEGFLKFD